jgi:hypothetical protein
MFLCDSFKHVWMGASSVYQLCHVRLSARISADPTGRISMKFDMGGFLWKSVFKCQIWLKSKKNIMHFTWIPRYLLPRTATINLFKRALFQWNGITVSVAGEVKTWRERLRYVYVTCLVRAIETTYRKKFSMSDKRFTQFYCNSSQQHRSVCSVRHL